MATGDTYASSTFVQEAFSRLWLFRSHMNGMARIENFLIEEIKRATRDYYGSASEQFRRSFVSLDAFNNNDFLLCELENEQEQVRGNQCPDEKDYIRKLNILMPNLRQDQQLLIRLCLEYGFNYDSIAEYLGGISAREIRCQVQHAIAQIRAVFENTAKLQILEKETKEQVSEVLKEEEALVLHLRCDQQLTFKEIATTLKIDLSVANSLFVSAYRKSRQSVCQIA